ncbi:hypothetical protein SLITO_v1c10110 [Spiroplasma litorale]|uniref:Lipoprotein n=1 Tax=Spiroplasma litorale TaxID=216942 RepID=A0A0K1W3D8_9MOLU|nr:hypothetical protein [Spiroplasma litorale]AKX34622.1 hypothetical protein SLITO_v1c10110 [Spiroplasma litorale]
MKKLTQILAVVSLLSTSITTVVSCGGSNKDKNSPSNPTGNLTETQKQMVEGAETLSRFILSSRHENLNYNLNEILSMYLTPIPTMLMMPVSYKFEDMDINFGTKISKYKKLLAPSIEKINNDNYSAVFASYVMGMYDDSFYRDFIENGHFKDSFNEKGGVGFNKKDKNNEMGILAGLDKNLKLSNDENRRNLSWAIQDTGALSNYLLDMGYDGVNPGDTNGTSSPMSPTSQEKGGTNGSGYLYYNSGISTGKGNRNSLNITKTVKDKIGEKNQYEPAKIDKNQYSSKINDISFNRTGSMIANTAGRMNLNGYINNFASLKDSISESSFGAEALLSVVNYITPMLASSEKITDLKMQIVALSLIYNMQSVINQIQSNDNAMNNFLKTNGFNKDVLSKLINVRKPIDSLEAVKDIKPEQVKITRLYQKNSDDKNDPIDNLKIVSSFIKELKMFYNNLKTDDLKEEFASKLFISKDSPFKKNYDLIINPPLMGGLGESGWLDLVGDKGSNAMNLLNMLDYTYESFSKNETKEFVQEVINNYYGRSITDLSRTEKQNLIKELGFDTSSNKYVKDSFFANYYNVLTNEEFEGSNELSNLFKRLSDNTSKDMMEVHQSALQYIYDDNFWSMSSPKINVTDPSEVNGEMEFTLEYKGNGDEESNADQQTTKIDVPENFNPYQTNIEHQKEFAQSDALKDKIDTSRISGKVLGKEKLNMSSEDLMKYDGKGQLYKKVNHKYKIIWRNISSDINNPHWVVVDIKSFNSDGKEFYNIY